MRFVALCVVFVREYDFVDGGHFLFQPHSRPGCEFFVGRHKPRRPVGWDFKSSLLLLASRFDPDGGSFKTKRAANLVFQKTLIGEVQFARSIGERNESWGSDGRLRQVLNSNSISGRGGALEVD